ncbi:hypothetical protein CcCBS67573_g10316 [Chytriomyces confervae]|uniref:Uncharacterized protein n=1 Tax=Chytriomyces confervae TaxID=246404 RepID=A0A507D4F6_9FUNG|nr:hypothetical protein HDU80_006142 [Chytriomyces hyalinus]TPX46389.1 hypothetical protein CcCBS67573_g10316 [Chytriomyces confervae]
MSLAFLVAVSSVSAQFLEGGPTQPGLPTGCVGSFPNLTQCTIANYYLGDTVDRCAPPAPYPVAGQQVYIKDSTNFCLNLPNPDSIFLFNNYYSWKKLPTIVQAEGFVQSYCMGSYLPPGSKPLPQYGIRSAHVVKNFTVPGQNYYQIHGYMDCDLLGINCTSTAPGRYDDAGQYDDGPFINCGKEPYSGVDASAAANPGMQHYVEMAGNGLFCMRVCEKGNLGPGLPCDLTQDTAGCEKFMKVQFLGEYATGFSYMDLANGVKTTASVFIPPKTSATLSGASAAATTGGGAAGPAGSAGDAAVSPTAVPTAKKSASLQIFNAFVVVLSVAPFFFM